MNHSDLSVDEAAERLRRLLKEGGTAGEVKLFLPVARILEPQLFLAINTAYVPPELVRKALGAPALDEETPNQPTHVPEFTSADSKDNEPFRTSRAAAQRECERWLSEEIPNSNPIRVKAEFRIAAQNSIRGLSKRAFDRAWANVAPRYGRNLPGAKKRSDQ